MTDHKTPLSDEVVKFPAEGYKVNAWVIFDDDLEQIRALEAKLAEAEKQARWTLALPDDAIEKEIGDLRKRLTKMHRRAQTAEAETAKLPDRMAWQNDEIAKLRIIVDDQAQLIRDITKGNNEMEARLEEMDGIEGVADLQERIRAYIGEVFYCDRTANGYSSAITELGRRFADYKTPGELRQERRES